MAFADNITMGDVEDGVGDDGGQVPPTPSPSPTPTPTPTPTPKPST